MTLPDNLLVKACVQGIIDACAAEGRDVVLRLQQLRAQQSLLADTAGEDQALRALASCMVAEADRRLQELDHSRRSHRPTRSRVISEAM